MHLFTFYKIVGPTQENNQGQKCNQQMSFKILKFSPISGFMGPTVQILIKPVETGQNKGVYKVCTKKSVHNRGFPYLSLRSKI
jgi:hypothetical protein